MAVTSWYGGAKRGISPRLGVIGSAGHASLTQAALLSTFARPRVPSPLLGSTCRLGFNALDRTMRRRPVALLFAGGLLGQWRGLNRVYSCLSQLSSLSPFFSTTSLVTRHL